MDFLEKLSDLKGDLIIENNDKLENIDGLKNLTSISGFLWIEGNTQLKNLDGLANLTEVKRSLYIKKNNELTYYETVLAAIGVKKIKRNWIINLGHFFVITIPLGLMAYVFISYKTI